MNETYDKKILKKQFTKNLLPSVSAMWVYSIYTIIDGIFVGKGVGANALGAVNIAMPFINLIFASSIFFATGASTLCSISLGEKNLKKAREIFSYNTVIITVFSILLTLFSLIFINNISRFLGATESNFFLVKDYLTIVVSFSVFFIVSYCLEVLTKADGFPHLAIIGVVISAITNIILDYFFVIKFAFGVKGAALATGISQVFSCAFFAIHFLRSKSKLKFVKFKPNLDIPKRIVAIGFPDGITELTSGIVILIFNQCILRLIGNDGIITYSVITYVSTLVLMTMIGITQGMQPLCSYYYGASNSQAVKYLFKITLKTITITSLFIFALCIIFAPFIVGSFINKSDDIVLFNNSISIFKVYSFAFLLMGFNILASGFCSSMELPIKATIISLSRGFILIILSLLLMIFIWGGKGIWLSTTLAEGLCLIISYLIIKKYFK